MDSHFPLESCNWAGNMQITSVANVKNSSYVQNVLENLKTTHVAQGFFGCKIWLQCEKFKIRKGNFFVTIFLFSEKFNTVWKKILKCIHHIWTLILLWQHFQAFFLKNQSSSKNLLPLNANSRLGCQTMMQHYKIEN